MARLLLGQIAGGTFSRCRGVARAILALSILAILLCASLGEGIAAHTATAPPLDGTAPLPAATTNESLRAIVVGFVGGFVRHDDAVHSEVQLAARLRTEFPSGVDVSTYESYRGEAARKKILTLLSANQSGRPTPEEKRNARIILYGHSWGGSEAIAVARELGRGGVPVLLTIQVDSVSRFFQNDQVIPPNVAEAANFYQPDGVIHGESAIRAADPTRTKILGNFKFDYRGRPYACAKYPWFDHYLVKPHTQIECDPNVWRQAEDLIREALSSSTPAAPSRDAASTRSPLPHQTALPF